MYVCVRESDHLEQELPTLVMWVLDIEPGSSGRVQSAVNHRTISPTPVNIFFQTKVHWKFKKANYTSLMANFYAID